MRIFKIAYLNLFFFSFYFCYQELYSSTRQTGCKLCVGVCGLMEGGCPFTFIPNFVSRPALPHRPVPSKEPLLPEEQRATFTCPLCRPRTHCAYTQSSCHLPFGFHVLPLLSPWPQLLRVFKDRTFSFLLVFKQLLLQKNSVCSL